MNSNLIIEEVWRIKEELAHEAGYDVHQLCENTRRWAAAHPHTGPIVRNAEEPRRLAAQPTPGDALMLKEEPPYPLQASTDDGSKPQKR